MLGAIVAFVLSMLCLFAGSKPGFMEEYSVIMLNTSTVGASIISARAASDSTPSSALRSIIDSDAHDKIASTNVEVSRDLNGIIGDDANKLAAELGIKQWYSMHLMDMCEGTYTPNATASGTKLNVTSCTNVTTMYHFNISEQISKELKTGKLHLDLSDIHWPSDIQNGLNDFAAALNALFAVYAIGIAAAGVSIITAFIALFLHGSHFVSFGNWSLTCLSFFALLAASLIITIVQVKAVDLINKYGNSIGVYASKGNKFLVLTWVAVGIMLLTVAAWSVDYCLARKMKNREYTEKVGSGSWWQRRKKSDEAYLRSHV